ncbi:MAG TPA: sulfatase [Actinomycetota bacterium]|nr:sulfatase [Actinomycetota bacterium]
MRVLLLVALLMAAGLACTGASTSGTPATERPNILIIVTDDQRADTLSDMPSVSRWFGNSGTRFTKAFATTPQCCPSRASILTGRYAHNHGVETNADTSRLDEATTLQRYLQDDGYTTAIVGKYLNRVGSYFDRENVAIDPRYFDRWATFLGGYVDPLFNIDGRLRQLEGYSTQLISERAVDLLQTLDAEDAEPWFLYVAPFAPHPPYQPENRYEAARVDKLVADEAFMERARRDKPRYVRRTDVKGSAVRQVRKQQLRTLRSVDDMVGDLFSALEELDESESTLAFYVSDNGYQWGEHGVLQKGYPYLESVQIPLLMRWPGRVAARSTDARLVANIDMLPTILDAAGIEVRPRDPIDGTSLLNNTARDELVLEFAGLKKRKIPPWTALVGDGFQYVEYYGSDGGGVLDREYYDLVEDPLQLENLAATSSGNVPREVVEDLRALRDCAGPTCP